MSNARPQVGDVFTVPLDDWRLGFGQVVGTYRKVGFFFALFDPAFLRDSTPEPCKVAELPVAFLALSVDAKIAAGHWVIVGNCPVVDQMPLPAFKEVVMGPQRVEIVDYSGERRRLASGEEATWVPNRTVIAPVRLEKALRAKHGLAPWHAAYGELVPSPVATTARLF